MEGGDCFMPAHLVAEAGGLLYVLPCDRERHMTATAGRSRLSSTTARCMLLSRVSSRRSWMSSAAGWTDVDGLIGMAFSVVMQAHG